MKRGIALKTLNHWLRRLGLVLVIQFDDDRQSSMRLWIERARSYDQRTQRATP